MNRRNFLKVFGITVGSTIFAKQSFASNQSDNFAHKAKLQMGTYVNISIRNESKDLRDEAFNAAFMEIERLEKILSYQTESSLFELNKNGFINQPPCELTELLQTSINIAKDTKGAFNPFVLPILEIVEQEKVSSYFELSKNFQEELITLSDYNKITVEKNKITFGILNQKASLCGIAKGYIIDKIAKLLLAMQIENFLIDAGGDIYAHGYYFAQETWKIAIIDASTNNTITIPLYNAALATSGNIFSKHIFSQAETPLYSASIISSSAYLADAYATACIGGSINQTISFANESKYPLLLQQKEKIIYDTLSLHSS